MSIDLRLSKALQYGLHQAVRDAFVRMNTKRVLARIEYVVKQRTARGQFLDGSSPGHEQYSKGHRKKRELKGHPTGHVNLFMTGRMLDAWRGQATVENDQLTLEAGYIDGLSEEEASKIAEYHDRLGAGRGKVIRRFVGLADDEATQIASMIEREFLKGFTRP